MADIRVDLKTELLNGQSVVFEAPCDCTEVTGMVAYYHDGSSIKNKRFDFKDSHGNNLAGLGNLFVKGAYVKVILDTVSGSAFIQNADTNSYIEKIDIQTTNATVLKDSKKGVLKLNDLVGNTEQKTLSGKNLYRTDGSGSNSGNGLTLTYESNTSKVVLNGTVTAEVGLCPCNALSLPKGTYTASVHGLNVLTSTVDRMLIQLNDGTSVVQNYIMVDKPKTFTLNEDTLVKCTYVFGNGSSYTNKEVTFQIEAGEVATEYEPYCGGGVPSPNPEFPQAIENTFDGVEMEQGAIMTGDGTNTSHNARVRSIRPIPCKSGDMIKIVTEKQFSLCNILYYNENGYIGYDYAQNMNVIEKTAKENATYFRFVIGSNTSITPETAGKITLTVNGKYVGQIVERWKNLLDCRSLSTYTHRGITFTPLFKDNGVLDYVNVNGTQNSSTESYIPLFENTSGFPHGIKAGDTLTLLNRDYNSNVMLIAYNYVKGTWVKLGATEYEDEVAFTINENATGFMLRIKVNQNATVSNYKCYPMLSKVGGEYEPYTEKVTTFFLNEPLRATDRVVRKDGVVYECHKSKTVVLNGTENLGKNATINTTNAFNITLDGYTQKSVVRSTHYSVVKNTNEVKDALYVGAKLHFLTDLSHNYTIDTFKEYLAEQYANGTPVILEYTVDEETYTPLDTESQIALNSLETFDTVTYIEVDSKVKPSGMEVEYAASNVSAVALKAEKEVADLQRVVNDRSTVQRFDGVDLSTVQGYVKAYCVECIDIPVNDEISNTGFYEQYQNNGVNIERYTVLNESGYGVGIYIRTNGVKWEKIVEKPKKIIGYDESKKVDIDITKYVGMTKSKWYLVPEDGLISIGLKSYADNSQLIAVSAIYINEDNSASATNLGSGHSSMSFQVFGGQYIMVNDYLSSGEGSIANYSFRPYRYS